MKKEMNTTKNNNMKKIIATNIPYLVSQHFDFVSDINNDIDLGFEYEVMFGSDHKQNLLARGIPIIGGQRFNKIEQSIILNRFGINTPKSYYNKNYQCIRSIDELNAYVDVDEFVVKPITGARGIGVKKIKREDFKKCLINPEHCNKIFKEEKEFLSFHEPDVPKDYINNNITCMLIQEPINVKREFRLLLFQPNNFLIYERSKSEDQFCGNLSHGSKSTPVSDTTNKKYIVPIKDKLGKLMNDFKYPFISVDIYVDQNDNVGCFEFQMEFAYEGFDYKMVKEYEITALNYYI